MYGIVWAPKSLAGKCWQPGLKLVLECVVQRFRMGIKACCAIRTDPFAWGCIQVYHGLPWCTIGLGFCGPKVVRKWILGAA